MEEEKFQVVEQDPLVEFLAVLEKFKAGEVTEAELDRWAKRVARSAGVKDAKMAIAAALLSYRDHLR
jgi:hypothetical protein